MATVCPFKGAYYNTERFKDLGDFVAPPYDIVTKKERDEFIRRNPKNIFALELPEKEFCKKDVKDKYDCAARLLKEWVNEGILFRDSRPSIYPYDIEYKVDGKSFVRRGFISLVRADDWEKRTVLPHEKTFQKVTEDRFSLRVATKAQFSQIFMLYRPSPGIKSILDTAPRTKLFEVRDDKGAIHRLERIDDEDHISWLKREFSGRNLYIADGHHRYTTAIRYRKEMEARYGLGENAPYNFTSAYLVDASDPGLVVLPTHRLLKIPEGIDCKTVRERLETFFDFEEIELSDSMGPSSHAEKFKDTLGKTCHQSLTVMFGKRRKAFLLKAKEKARAELLKALGHKELACLDVVLLEELVFKKGLGVDTNNLEIGKDIWYCPDSHEAISMLREDRILFFMSPTKVEQVLDVADAGLCMPHKSTFFYPKILTGMVISLEDY